MPMTNTTPLTFTTPVVTPVTPDVIAVFAMDRYGRSWTAVFSNEHAGGGLVHDPANGSEEINGEHSPNTDLFLAVARKAVSK